MMQTGTGKNAPEKNTKTKKQKKNTSDKNRGKMEFWSARGAGHLFKLKAGMSKSGPWERQEKGKERN